MPFAHTPFHTLSRSLRWLFVLTLALPGVTRAQGAAITTANVILRTGPSATSRRIMTIDAGDTVQLLAAKKRNGYVRIASPEGQTGWAVSTRIRLVSTSGGLTNNPTRVADTGTVSVGDGDITNWEKPEPVEQNGGACVAQGLGKNGKPALDPQTDLRKNRVDTSSAYHPVTFTQILALPWTGLPRKRTGWSQADSLQVAKYEGPPVTLEGYLVDVVEEGMESTNCEINTHAWHDWHMWMVPTPAEATNRVRTRAIVVEVTPRVRESLTSWVFDSVRTLARHTDEVRISGWLMWDPDHPDQVGKTRGTTWEIHPVTRIEVLRAGSWIDLNSH